MDRRTAVKQLAFLSLGSLAATTSGSTHRPKLGSQPSLCVLLHGTFGVVIPENSRYIQLIMPKIKTHIYTAGNKYLGGSGLIGSPLRVGATYVLDGVDPAQVLGASGKPQHVAKSSCKDAGITTVDPLLKTFCTIILPTPQEILPVNGQKRSDGKKWFSKVPTNFQQPDDLPRTLILSYGSVAGTPSFISLVDYEPLWLADTPNDGGNYTLHIRAEKDPKVCTHHSNHFEKLLKLTPPLNTDLQMDIPDSSVLQNVNTPLPGCIDPGEEQTLQQVLLELQTKERQHSEETQRQMPPQPRVCPDSTEVANCQSIILTRP
jgi:hypothetical protein